MAIRRRTITRRGIDVDIVGAQERTQDGQTVIKLTATAGQTILERRFTMGALEHAYRGKDDATTRAQMQVDLDKERDTVADEAADREKVRTMVDRLI